MNTRKVNVFTDSKPGKHHEFEANLIKDFIKNKSLLDIGCWTGQFISLIENISKCTGIEPEASAVKYAKQNRKSKFVVGSALKLPFDKSSYDVVTMWDVIEHLPTNTESRAISEIKRVLKRNGYFAISTVTTHPLAILLDPAFFLIGHRHYSQGYLVELLEKYGFKIIKIVYTGRIWTLIRDNLGLVMKYIFKKPLISNFLDTKVLEEFTGGGFVQIHILAKSEYVKTL